ncbi:MAG TPA: phosphoribosylanthranilate isomerase [Aquificaceae bacterium]|nr:phosphoribosylanthranilate isomerase [Aquificaceae bacterium]HIQ49243.1 phosphoribosylanthranilate isomerase [Aquifex aeolicus]
MVKVKICGITSPEDALFSANTGADYIGLITYKKSPRYVSKEKRLEILNAVKKYFVRKVAVVVNESYEFIRELLDEGFDLIQLHGDENISLAKKVGMERVIKVFRVKDTVPSVGEWKKAYAILLDTYSKNLYGGTGKTFNWEIASKLVEEGYKIFLSGGLRPENVEKAIRQVKPYAVDVSSGVEREKGKKDYRKVEEFVKTVKSLKI